MENRPRGNVYCKKYALQKEKENSANDYSRCRRPHTFFVSQNQKTKKKDTRNNKGRGEEKTKEHERKDTRCIIVLSMISLCSEEGTFSVLYAHIFIINLKLHSCTFKKKKKSLQKGNTVEIARFVRVRVKSRLTCE